jgi:septation ring formation regulator EzrA
MSDKADKGLLGKAGGLWNRFAYVETPEQAPKAPVTTATPNATPSSSEPVATTSSSQNNLENSEVFKDLEKDVMNVATPYSALLGQAETLREFIPDEAKRIQAAAKTGGITIRSVLGGLDKHLQCLTEEEQKFELVVERQVADDVSSKEAELTRIEEDTKTKRNQVAALQKSITDNEGRAAGIRTDINSKRSLIADRKAEFATAASTIRARLEKAKQDFTRILGG